MAITESRIVLAFSSVGHTFSHLVMLLFPTIIIALESEWGAPYSELNMLLLGGQLLFGAAALPAGIIGDKWSAPKMMLIYFFGTGAACIATGYSNSPWEMGIGLAAIGLFASIYHPVGIAWLVRDAKNRGKALGISGLFGAIGVAGGPLVAGIMIDLDGWRAAFIVPGLACMAVGVLMLPFMGRLKDRPAPEKPVHTGENHRNDLIRTAMVLVVTVICSGIIYQALSISLPKLFDTRLASITGGDTAMLGTLVAAVFFFSAMSQLIGGWLADRYSVRAVYFIFWALQGPLLFVAAGMSSVMLWPTIAAVFCASSAALPAENSLFAKYAPPQWRSTAFGLKFVLALGVSAAAVPLVSYLHAATGGFFWLLVVLSVMAGVAAVAAFMLPSGKGSARDVAPEAAE